MDQKLKQTTRIGAYGIILRGEGILLCRLSKHVRTFAGFWTLPGGGLEFGEHPEETLTREIEEETGLVTKPIKLVGINNITRETAGDAYQSIQIVYLVELLGDQSVGPLRFEINGTTDKCEWLNLGLLESERCVGLVPAALKLAGLDK